MAEQTEPAGRRNDSDNGLTLMGKGFAMGSADIIPGVSGGTMALILGIYERLLLAIRSFDMVWVRDLAGGRVAAALGRNDLGFLIPLGLGIVGALAFFTRVVPLPELIETHPEMIYGLFFGLILASVWVLLSEAPAFGAREAGWVLLGAIAGFAVVNLVPVETPTALWFIFLCGFVAISAMLLPGISGSFILLILGKYAYIIDALGRVDLVIIGVFLAGMVCGVLAFSRAVTWLLARFHDATMMVIIGILLGSLWVIWPFQARSYATVGDEEKLVGSTPVWPGALDGEALAAFGLLAAGFVLVLVLHRLGKRA
jgi:putative membrane protein